MTMMDTINDDVVILNFDTTKFECNMEILEREPSLFNPSENDLRGIIEYYPSPSRTIKFFHENRHYVFSWTVGEESQPESGGIIRAFCEETQAWTNLRLPDY